MIWVPLLESVAADHAHFPAVLTSRIITHLLSDDDNPPADANKPEPDPDDTNANATMTAAAAEKASYDVCLANWATWLIEWRRSDEKTDADVAARRQSVFFQLAQALGTPKHIHEQETSSPQSQTGCVAFLSESTTCQGDRLTIRNPLSPPSANYLLRTGRGRCSTLCAPQIVGSPGSQTPSWVWIQGVLFPRWVTLTSYI